MPVEQRNLPRTVERVWRLIKGDLIFAPIADWTDKSQCWKIDSQRPEPQNRSFCETLIRILRTYTDKREELNSLRSALDAASASKRQLEASAHRANETCDRLTSANDMLSAKVLSLAEDTDIERKHLSKKWQEEMDELKKRLVEAQEEVDEAKTRGQAQRIQLLDEVSRCSAWVSANRLTNSSIRCKPKMGISGNSFAV